MEIPRSPWLFDSFVLLHVLMQVLKLLFQFHVYLFSFLVGYNVKQRMATSQPLKGKNTIKISKTKYKTYRREGDNT